MFDHDICIENCTCDVGKLTAVIQKIIIDDKSEDDNDKFLNIMHWQSQTLCGKRFLLEYAPMNWFQGTDEKVTKYMEAFPHCQRMQDYSRDYYSYLMNTLFEE